MYVKVLFYTLQPIVRLCMKQIFFIFRYQREQEPTRAAVPGAIGGKLSECCKYIIISFNVYHTVHM